jgi:hypothetical protein
MRDYNSKVPGPKVPAFLRQLLSAILPLLALTLAIPAAAQQGQGYPGLPPVQQQQASQQQASLTPGVAPPSVRPVPGQLELAKLVWSTMAAVDHANKSGNYSVLRDISSTGFQIQNDAAKLAQVFAKIRDSRIDLSNTLLVPPTYTAAPRQLQADVFEVKGVFNLRPVAIAFDMYFQWERGEWRLYGIDIRPLPMNDKLETSKTSSNGR